ncbi:MAG: hypothetical protein WKF94_13420 [Solirubrobacteraceae bacterium]
MLRLAVVPCLLLVFATASGAAYAGGPTAQAAKSCGISGKERSFGATYVTTLSTRNTSCRNGEGVVRGFHRCRRELGGDTCSRKVDGYRCTQTKLATSPLQYDARVTCTRGGKRVKHTYTQNT